MLVNGSDDRSVAVITALGGDVTTAVSRLELEPAAALDEAARLARAETVVVLSPRARPTAGWLARLVAPLSDPTVAVSCAAVVDERNLVVHAGFDLVGDSAIPTLRARARSAFLRAEVALESGCDVDAVGAEAFAVRRELWEDLRGLAPGWSEQEAVVDLSLRAPSRPALCGGRRLCCYGRATSRGPGQPGAPGMALGRAHEVASPFDATGVGLVAHADLDAHRARLDGHGGAGEASCRRGESDR